MVQKPSSPVADPERFIATLLLHSHIGFYMRSAGHLGSHTDVGASLQ